MKVDRKRVVCMPYTDQTTTDNGSLNCSSTLDSKKVLRYGMSKISNGTEEFIRGNLTDNGEVLSMKIKKYDNTQKKRTSRMANILGDLEIPLLCDDYCVSISRSYYYNIPYIYY